MSGGFWSDFQNCEMIDDILHKLTASEIALLISVIGAAGVSIGAIIGAASSLIVTYINRSSEERRHFRELGVQIAIEKFKQSLDLAQTTANATGRPISLPGFDAFLIHSIRLMEIVAEPGLSANETASKINKLGEFTDTLRSNVSTRS